MRRLVYFSCLIAAFVLILIGAIWFDTYRYRSSIVAATKVCNDQLISLEKKYLDGLSAISSINTDSLLTDYSEDLPWDERLDAFATITLKTQQILATTVDPNNVASRGVEYTLVGQINRHRVLLEQCQETFQMARNNNISLLPK
jgi:hypothetical protein